MIRLLAAAALSLAPIPAIADEVVVDLELILAVDVSNSIDHNEARLQRDGYIAALGDESVVAAILAGSNGRIALAYVEWAGIDHFEVIVGWHLVDSDESAAQFAARLNAAAVTRAQTTATGAAIDRAAASFAGNGFAGARRVIDISGDGIANTGPRVERARDRAVAAGITINGLPITSDPDNPHNLPNKVDLARYWRECVIGGPGAFVVVAESFKTFSRAVREKLVLEISGHTPPPTARLWRAQLTPEIAICDIW